MELDNPYQTPQSSLERNFKVLGAKGYRDGGHIIVRDGFLAPKVCVVTGQPVEEEGKRKKLFMKPANQLAGILKPQFLILVLSNGLLAPILSWQDDHFIGKALYIAWLLFVADLYKRSFSSINFYCKPEVYKKLFIRKVVTLITAYSGFLLLVIGATGSLSPPWIALAIALITISVCAREKPLLKSLGREGDYERFEGAHPNFLQALPDKDS